MNHLPPRLLVALLLPCSLALPAAAARAQTIAPLVAALAKAETLDDEAIGEGGIASPTWKAFEALRAQATMDELKGLLAHASPIVRGYAWRGLMDTQPAADWPKLLAAGANDVARVTTFVGCIQAEQLLGDVVLEWARHRKLLTDDQWLDLGEVLVQGKSILDTRDLLLRTLRFRPAMHAKLRELAKGGDGSAHVALARYADAADLPALTTWLARDRAFDDTTAFLAAQAFPHAGLLAALERSEAKGRAAIADGRMGIVREWLAAVAAQKSPAAAALLARVLTTTADGRQREVVQAMKGVLVPYGGDPVFADVREALKQFARR